MEAKSEKAQKTRKAILQAAEKLFLKRHIDKTTVSDIVKEAGVAKGTFYLYFDSKDELARSLVAEGLTGFNEEMEKLLLAPVSKQTIVDFITRLVELAVKNQKLYKVIHHETFLQFLDYGNKQKELEEYYANLFKQWLDRGVAKRLITIKDTDFYAKFITISLHEVIERMVLDQLDYPMDRAQEHLIELLNRTIGFD